MGLVWVYLRQLQARLQDVINEAQDDVRFYLLCHECLGKVVVLGRAVLNRPQDYMVV